MKSWIVHFFLFFSLWIDVWVDFDTKQCKVQSTSLKHFMSKILALVTDIIKQPKQSLDWSHQWYILIVHDMINVYCLYGAKTLQIGEGW